ncbi:hypothetical protein ACXYMU_17865 [Pontibacter sp. CAU 1760]
MKKLLPLVFFFSILAAQAQSNLFRNPDAFLNEVKVTLEAGRVENAGQLGVALEEVWNSGQLTARQQEQVMQLTQRMHRRHISGVRFSQFFVMLTAGINQQHMRARQLDEMLDVTEKVLRNEELKQVEQFLASASLYLSINQLFQNPAFSLRSTGAEFSFAYAGASQATAEVPASDEDWGDTSWDDEVDAQGNAAEDDAWGITPIAKKPVARSNASKKRSELQKRPFIPAQPKITGPVLLLQKTNLLFSTPHDSIALTQTAGQLMLATNTFVGEGGEFSWQVKGQPVKATLRQYSFNASSPRFVAPDVTLHYPAVLAGPVDGALEWQSSKRKTASEYPYPKFTSFTNNARLTNLGDNMVYKGGFSLAGATIGSKPLDGSLSEIAVFQNGQRKFRATAQSYTLQDSLLLANRAQVAIYQEKDSISHPAVQLHFLRQTQELTLTKTKGPYKELPFYDNYHRVELTAERLQWKLTEPTIELSILNTKSMVPMRVESTTYFSNGRFQRLVGVSPFHPLQLLVGYAGQSRKTAFYAADVAHTMRVAEAAVKDAARAMSYLGYTTYEPASGYITLLPKALHTVGAARGTKDYDYLTIKSLVPSGRNATLNLDDNILTVRGVEKVQFNNDTASVYALPRRQEVHLLKNRDMEFDGQVFAGRLAISGAAFRFNYEDFSLDLTKIDTVAMIARRRRRNGGKNLSQVLTGNSGSMPGKLYINKPNNKSGKEFFADYPKFDAQVGARVAYANPDVAGGAYDNTVFFEMPPFKIDSLSSGKGAIGMDGTFNSGGIFPPIKTKLVMMPDETLGFYYQPGPKGIPAYGGKGMVYDTVMLDAAGIQSKGTLKYLGATVKARNFAYRQDGVSVTNGTSWQLTEGQLNNAEFPLATSTGFSMNWLPQADTMYLQTGSEPMKLYREGFALNGGVKLTPGGLYGAGMLETAVASIASKQMHLRQRSFSGSHGQVLVKSDVEDKPAVKATDVAFAYNISKGQVDFESEQKGKPSLEFPKAQYKTSMNSARWDIKAEKISLKADETGAKNWFYSLHPDQQGLRFIAASGEYDLKSNHLLAGGVPYIAVADMHVIPDKGHVAVGADATIQTLRNARVLADSAQQFHPLHSGNIDILSRMALEGDAVHDYRNAKEEDFKIRLSDFMYAPQANSKKEKSQPYTTATATIGEEDPFYIFPRVLYRGQVTMQVPRQHLDFDGELKLNFTGNPSDSDWFPYKKDTLNPADLSIPIFKPTATDGTPLFTGLHLSMGTGDYYSTFVSRKQAPDDVDLFTVEGQLSYSKEQKAFQLGQERRVSGETYEGNLLQYHEATNTTHFEGKLSLLPPSKNFNIEAAGSGKAQTESQQYTLDALLAFDLTLPSKALSAMAHTLRANAVAGLGMPETDESLLYKLGALIGEKEVRQYQQEASRAYVPLPKASRKLVRSLVLPEVKLEWSNQQKAWYSVGEISLSNILKEDINTRLDGYLELRQDMAGLPVVNLYLQADPYTWYYFSYFENGLTMASSDEKFNKAIGSKSKYSRGATSKYSIYLSEEFDKNLFVETYRRNYLTGKESFKVASEQVQPQPTGNFDYLEELPQKEKRSKKRRKKKDPSLFEEAAW